MVVLNHFWRAGGVCQEAPLYELGAQVTCEQAQKNGG